MKRTAIIKRGLTAPIEMDVFADERLVASIRCIEYEAENNLISCIHDNYRSYVFVDDYTVTTWKPNYNN